MSPISVDIGVPINTTSCPICGSSMEGDQTDRIVEFMRPHLAAERKATVERIRLQVLDVHVGIHSEDTRDEVLAILDAEAARGA